MASESEQMRFYAVHLPALLRGVHHARWDLVEPMVLNDPSAWYTSFDNQEAAKYFAKHGTVDGYQERHCHSQLASQRYSPLIVRFQERNEDGGNHKQEQEEDDGMRLEDLQQGQSLGSRYYAIAKGRKPGIYDDWEEAKKQVDGFRGNDHSKFPDLKSAASYLRNSGMPDDKIRLFRKTFKQQADFTPNPTAAFKDEFKRFASSQQWTGHEKRRARVDAIRDEIIHHFLPDGIRISAEQDDDEGYVDLDDAQTLEIFQGMCRKARKSIYLSIDLCLLELKSCPYVNIMDFVGM